MPLQRNSDSRRPHKVRLVAQYFTSILVPLVQAFFTYFFLNLPQTFQAKRDLSNALTCLHFFPSFQRMPSLPTHPPSLLWGLGKFTCCSSSSAWTFPIAALRTSRRRAKCLSTQGNQQKPPQAHLTGHAGALGHIPRQHSGQAQSHLMYGSLSKSVKACKGSPDC